MAPENHRALLAPMLAEKLESRGLDDEMLEVLMEKESVIYSRLESHEADMPKDVRFSALCFLRCCRFQVPGDPLKATAYYINAVQLLDFATHQPLGSPQGIGSVLAVAAAAWSLVEKMHSSNREQNVQISQLATLAEILLRSPTVGATDIEQQERALISKCNVSAPSAWTWCNLFSARLDVVLNGVLVRKGHSKHVDAILANVLFMVVELSRVSRRNTPCIIAAGSFCLALAVAELVPVSEVIDLGRPLMQKPGTTSFESKLAWLKENLGSPCPECIVPPKAMMAATVVALHSNAHDLKLATTSLVERLFFPQ